MVYGLLTITPVPKKVARQSRADMGSDFRASAGDDTVQEWADDPIPIARLSTSSTCIVSIPPDRLKDVVAQLADQNIATRRWRALGCHREPAFADCPSHSLVVTDRLAVSTLGLPYYADMGRRQIDRLAHALKRAMT